MHIAHKHMSEDKNVNGIIHKCIGGIGRKKRSGKGLEGILTSIIIILRIQKPEQPVSRAEDCHAMCTNCGKIAFADSGTVLPYCIDQTFMRSNLDLLQAYNNLDTGQKCKCPSYWKVQIRPKRSLKVWSIQ